MTGPAIDPILVLSALLVFLQAVAASVLLTPIARDVAHKRGWLDRPEGNRRIHDIPIPRIGGVAVYLSFTVAFSWCAAVLSQTVHGSLRVGEGYLPVIIAAGAVMLIGLADDLIGVSPASKVFVQTASALYLYGVGFRIGLITNPFGDPIALGWLSLPLTLLWFVGMSNAFNLIDGLDGLAAGVGFFATISLFVAAVLNDRWDAAILIAALGGALLGFLRFNFSPASIFLGDSGSLSIGFALAAVAIRSSMKASAAIAVAAPLFALALPMLDVLIAVTRRLLTGRNIFEADRDHIHHRLLRLGLTPRKAVIILYGVAALFASLSLVSMSGRTQVIGAMFLISVLLMWAGVRQLGYTEFGELQNILTRRLLNDRRVYTNNVQLIQFRESLLEARSVPELWATLTGMADRLRFTSVRLALRSPWDERAGRMLAAGESAYAVQLLVTEPPCTPWSWTIGLGEGGESMGEVVLTQDMAVKMLSFEPSYFVGAVSREFAGSLRRLLSPPDLTMAPSAERESTPPVQDDRALIATEVSIETSSRR
jgi:UDP-GlcNAc:undecaprenyl-phosphate GlcNAc-1-phosphate transferase